MPCCLTAVTQSLTSHFLQSNADASLLSGAINPTTVRQGIFGFNGRNLLQSVKVCTALQELNQVQVLSALYAQGFPCRIPARPAGRHIIYEACL